jgi:peptidoglycan-associated lipoprotein
MSGQRLAAYVLVVAVLAFGCARTPAMTGAAAPAPTGSAAASQADSRKAERSSDRLQPASQRGTTAVSGTTARPNPTEFGPASELGDIHFDFDRYDIRPGDAKILDTDATWLKTNGYQLLIEGHCDERGTNEYNVALGERRAKSTMNYLVAHGIAATRMTIVSYGEERPVCAEHQESCWSQNRRAHFLVKRD